LGLLADTAMAVAMSSASSRKGRRGKKVMEVTCIVHICRSPKKRQSLNSLPFLFFIDFFNRVFWRFVTRGRVQKHEILFSKKNPGSSQKNVALFPLRLFSLPRLFFARFYLIAFLAFRNKGVQKRLKKNRGKLSAARQKSTYLLHFCVIFFTAPLDLALMLLVASASYFRVLK
jgi:hypothetical protein